MHLSIICLSACLYTYLCFSSDPTSPVKTNMAGKSPFLIGDTYIFKWLVCFFAFPLWCWFSGGVTSWCLEGSDERSWGYLESLQNRELRSYAQVSKYILDNHFFIREVNNPLDAFSTTSPWPKVRALSPSSPSGARWWMYHEGKGLLLKSCQIIPLPPKDGFELIYVEGNIIEFHNSVLNHIYKGIPLH